MSDKLTYLILANQMTIMAALAELIAKGNSRLAIERLNLAFTKTDECLKSEFSET